MMPVPERPVNLYRRRVVPLAMNPNARRPVPPAEPPTPPSGGRHTRPADVVAHRVIGEPLPCLCPDCGGRIAGWERERARTLAIVDTLPPAFWTRQTARLLDAGRGPAPRWRWAIAPAACLLLAAALFVLPSRSPGAPDDFEARWADVQEALERPALGDLEACAVLIDEGENTSPEESL